MAPKATTPSKFADYLAKRWAEGHRSARHLLPKLKACGYAGSQTHLERPLGQQHRSPARSYVAAPFAHTLRKTPYGILTPAPAVRFGFDDTKRLSKTLDVTLKEPAIGCLIYRYSAPTQEEAAFRACSFWIAEALALLARHDEAEKLLREIGDYPKTALAS